MNATKICYLIATIILNFLFKSYITQMDYRKRISFYILIRTIKTRSTRTAVKLLINVWSSINCHDTYIRQAVQAFIKSEKGNPWSKRTKCYIRLAVSMVHSFIENVWVYAIYSWFGVEENHSLRRRVAFLNSMFPITSSRLPLQLMRDWARLFIWSSTCTTRREFCNNFVSFSLSNTYD